MCFVWVVCWLKMMSGADIMSFPFVVLSTIVGVCYWAPSRDAKFLDIGFSHCRTGSVWSNKTGLNKD